MTSIDALKREIALKDRALHRKNVALDAMGWVWCSGGCPGGTGRFTPTEITEEVVLAAERNTARLRRWFENRQFREGWAKWSQEERDAWMSAQIPPATPINADTQED